MVAVGAISFALAFEYPWLAGWSYFVLGPALGIHGSVFGKRVRVLAAKLETTLRDLRLRPQGSCPKAKYCVRTPPH